MLDHIRYLTALILFQVPLCTLAQTSGSAQFSLHSQGIQQWFPGWYVTSENDTVHGFIFLSNQVDNQVMFKYSKNNPPGMDVATLQAAQAKGFLVKDRVYESLQLTNDKNATLSFIRRIEKGRLNLYAWYNLPDHGTIREGQHDRPVTVNDEKFHEFTYLLKMGGEVPFAVPASKDFAEAMSKMVADDKSLAQKISQELTGYRSGDIVNIVQEYNKWSAAPH